MKRVKWGAVLALLWIAGLSACAPRESKQTLDEVTVQLKWVHQAQFAGFYWAQEKGYYARENLKVHFREGGLGIDSAQPVISGEAAFGVITPEDVLINRSQGAPLTAVAAIYRRSAVVFVALADSGIIRPADFLGKTVAAASTGGSNRDFELQFQALIKKLKLNSSEINLTPYDSEYSDFYKGKAEVTAAYLTSGVIKIRQKGYKLNLIWPGDYGVGFYSDTLVTNDRLIAQKPELVTRFLRATLKGWQEAVGDPAAAAVISLKYSLNQDLKFQLAMMEALLPMVHTGEDRIGWMKPEIWQEMSRMMLEQGILSRNVNGEQAYTLRFLNEIYGGRFK
jgi:NitT/TauT family transport system substrate-binding protein